MVRILISKGVDPNALEPDGEWTPWHHALWQSNLQAGRETGTKKDKFIEDCAEIVKLFLKTGADPLVVVKQK